MFVDMEMHLFKNKNKMYYLNSWQLWNLGLYKYY